MYAAHYAIVRFLPFVETEEFANVGVVLFAPAARYFGFKLLVNRYGRINNFFEQLDAKVFRTAMATFRDELGRLDALFKRMGTDRRFRSLDHDNAITLWQELVKPRETMIRFGEPRLVIAEDVKKKLLALYDFYVQRNFVTREYHEQILDRGVRAWLKEVDLQNRFVAKRVGNDEYDALFPFVELRNDEPIKVIKPLNLRYPDPARIIDHGGQWVVRINALKKRRLLPAQVLFAVEGPHEVQTARARAHAEVVHDLESTGVAVAPYQDRQRVIEFARA